MNFPNVAYKGKIAQNPFGTKNEKSKSKREHHFNKYETWDIYERQKKISGEINGNPICPLCGKEVRFPDGEIDHIIPVSISKDAVDKTHVLSQSENLQFTHKRCNQLKGTLSQREAIKKIRGDSE